MPTNLTVKAKLAGPYLFCYFLFVSLLIAVASCAASHAKYMPVGTVIDRAPAPCGRYDAVVTEITGSNAGNAIMQIFLVPHDEKPQPDMVFFRATQVKELKLIWISNQRLLIRYKGAWVSYFYSYPGLSQVEERTGLRTHVELAPEDLVPASTIEELQKEE